MLFEPSLRLLASILGGLGLLTVEILDLVVSLFDDLFLLCFHVVPVFLGDFFLLVFGMLLCEFTLDVPSLPVDVLEFLFKVFHLCVDVVVDGLELLLLRVELLLFLFAVCQQFLDGADDFVVAYSLLELMLVLCRQGTDVRVLVSFTRVAEARELQLEILNFFTVLCVLFTKLLALHVQL